MSGTAERMSTKAYFVHLWNHFIQHCLFWFVLAGTVLWIVSRYYGVGINISYSLPHHVYVVAKQKGYQDLRVGDYTSFNWQGGYYPHGTLFVKQVAGKEGDTVSRVGREFFVNGLSVGVAKEYSQDGEPLTPNSFEGVIPPGHLWVSAPHKDSLDSRYEYTGLIRADQLRGKVYPLF